MTHLHWNRPLTLSLCTVAGGLCSAQTAGPVLTAPVAELRSVMITATRQPTLALTTPATVSVIDDIQLQETLVNDFRDLFRYEPGIAVKSDPHGRGEEAGIEVRGIGGQRLGMRVDGVRLPNGYVSAGANAGQMKLDPLSLRRVEVLRGPASSLYGSDALAGVVLFSTLSPTDFLDGDRPIGGNAAMGYDSSNNGRYLAANLAFAAGSSKNLISLTKRKRQVAQNHDDSALTPNPQDASGQNLLFKSILELGDSQNVTLTGEHYEQQNRTDQVSLAVPIVGGTRINSSQADDRSTRSRLGLAYLYSPAKTWFNTLSAQIDYQRSGSQERTIESRKPPGPAPLVLRDTTMTYREPQWSGSLQLNGLASAGAWTHRWLAGVDVLAKSVSVVNEGVQRTASGGAPSSLIDGERYPRKLAPDTKMRNIGLFVQDELGFAEGRLKFTPSLRYDYYSLSPQPDAMFANANVAGSTPVGLSKSAVTPRLSLSYEWRPLQVVYANYLTGFRMPTYDQLNRIGQVPVATFVHDFVPSPHLRPEKSKGVELGMKGQSATAAYELSAFYNRYTDFIDTEMTAFIPAGPLVGPRPIRRLQSRNVGQVEIYGVEAKGHLLLNPATDEDHRWRLLGALQWSMGNDKNRHQPINSIQPARLVAGLRWDQRGGRYGTQLIGNWVAAKKRVNQALTQTGRTAPVPLTTAGYVTADLTAYFRLGKQATLNLAVFNLFDRKYFDWATVAGLSGNDPRLGEHTASGRSLSASLNFDF